MSARLEPDEFFLLPPLVGRVTTEEPGMRGVRIKRLDAALRGGEEPQRPRWATINACRATRLVVQLCGAAAGTFRTWHSETAT